NDLVINDDVIQSKDLNKSEELSSEVEEVLLSMESMRVVNMAQDEKIDKILESINCIETMISRLRPSFLYKRHAKSSDIDIHTTISDDEDDLIELDKRSFTQDDAFNIEINMDKPTSPTIRAATKKKNISKGKTIMGTQKKLPFTPPGRIRKPKIEPKSFNKSKASYTLSQPTKDYRRPILELAALRCTDEQSDVSFKTTWQLPPRFVANVLEQVIKSKFYKDDDYKIKRPEDIPQCSSSWNSATWVMKWMDMTFEFKPNGNNK
ncbi:hypothetical protein S245_036373, partial [Arachis hypogaea]